MFVIETIDSHPFPPKLFFIFSLLSDGCLCTLRYSGSNCRVILDSFGPISISGTSTKEPILYQVHGIQELAGVAQSSGKWNNKHRLTQDQSQPTGGDDHLCLEDSEKSSQRSDTLAEFGRGGEEEFAEPVKEERASWTNGTPIVKKGALEHKV